MCKTNVKMDLYYANMWKHEHEKNMTRLWCKIVPKTNVEQTKGNEGLYSYWYPFRNLAQGIKSKEASMCASNKEAFQTRMLFCERMSVNHEHVNVNKWTQRNLFRNILLMSMEYSLTYKMDYLVMWKNILPRVMDERFSWMKKWMNFQMNINNK
jgi:hypothetical protein